MPIHVFLMDDHEVVRAGLRALIDQEADMEVVGEASTGAQALEAIPTVHPDVAILDVRLPDGSGIEVCRDIRSQLPDVACIMLTSYADDEALLGAIVAGASGYILKQVGGSDLVDNIRKVYRGESLLDPALSRQARERIRSSNTEDPRVASLTGQERKILDLIAEGWTNRQIANELFLAEKTVKNYVSNLLAKLGMQRRTEAAVYATRLAERRHQHDS